METRAGYMVVGGFVLLTFGGILAFFLWLAKTDLEYKVDYFTIYFPGSVTGLTIGGSVNYLGVPVGNVKNIELDANNLEVVNVTVAIKESIPIKEDTYAILELQGLTGYKFVQLYGGSADSPRLKVKPGERYPVIHSRYSGVEEIMTTLPRMVNKFTNLVDRINATFNEENRKRFTEALKNINELSERLAESAGPLKELVEDTSHAMKTFDHEMKDFSKTAQGSLRSVNSVADEIQTYLNANQIALDTITQTGSYELIQTLKETRDMMTKATGFFEKVEQNPRSLIFNTQRKGISIPAQ